MKLLVSDYDRTFKTNVRGLKINIDYIQKFREKGHKFLLATGRTYSSIKKQIDIFNIPYDYVSCNDGAVLFNNKDDVLYTKYLNVKDIELLLSRITKLVPFKQLKLYGMYGEINSLNDLVEIFVETKPFHSKETLFYLLREYDNIETVSILNQTYIESIGGKSRSIEYLNEQNNFDEIITIGDSINDLQMLKQYNGYKMLIATPHLYLHGIKTITSVKRLIKKHL